jgi:acetylornithine deacetylase/succinyl-diaminopimelate desuccinylase-like protein
MKDLQAYIEKNSSRFIDELFSILRIPSVSAQPSHKEDMHRMAKAVEDALLKAGCDKVEICDTPGYPIVYGEKIINPDLPTILVYGHYDVQPEDPVELWESSPFDPVIKKTKLHPQGAIFARGSSDDKGQFFIHVKALEYMVNTSQLPCNVKFMIEGEEEVGSGGLEWFVKRNQEKLSNDIILISDTGMISNEQPSITTGLRGLAAVEVEVSGPKRDLHSGLYGGAVANPVNILSKMIASLHDENNKINIPGFYDDVENVTNEERSEMAKIPFDIEEFKSSIGIPEIHGEEGYSTIERISIRPTLDVNGMWGGYTGEGGKTIIPTKATAKITMRLVPNQNPDKILSLFENYFKSIAPPSVRVTIKPSHGGTAYVMPINHKGYKAAYKAYKQAFGTPPLPQRSGGSIPIVSLFEQELKSKTVLMGFGLDSDAIHSPNEHFGIYNFLKGIETVPLFFQYFTREL